MIVTRAEINKMKAAAREQLRDKGINWPTCYNWHIESKDNGKLFGVFRFWYYMDGTRWGCNSETNKAVIKVPVCA